MTGDCSSFLPSFSSASSDEVESSFSSASSDEVESSFSSCSSDEVESSFSSHSSDEVESSFSSRSSDEVESSFSSRSSDEVESSFSSCLNDNVATDSLNQPLYDGTDLTVWDTYLVLMQHSLRHNLTKRAFSDLLKVVGMLLPRTSIGLVSYYKLWKFFMDLYGDLEFSSHFCCSSCQTAIDSEKAACPIGCDDSTAIEYLAVSV